MKKYEFMLTIVVDGDSRQEAALRAAAVVENIRQDQNRVRLVTVATSLQEVK